MQFVKLTASALIVTAFSACGGGSASTSSISSPSPQPITANPASQAVSSVTLSGTLTYDRVPHTQNSSLNYANTMELPIRGAVVEAVNASGEVLASALSGPNGAYTMTVDPQTNIRIQVKSQLLSSGTATWDFSVTDNTQGNQLYALQGSIASTGANAQQRRNLHAGHGWTGQSYGAPRSAAPFAILDSVYSAAQTFAAIDPNIDFPALELRWSVDNRTIIGDRSLGHIGTSAYFPDENAGTGAIYVLGEDGRDTDEYDQHVIIHEWGHYFEDKLSRTDSIGGLHSLSDRLDARVALSEGWSNALSAIISGDPIYRDSSGANQNFGFSYNLENSDIHNPGWFNEASVGSIIYDIFDDGLENSDDIAAGLAPLYTVLRSADYTDMPVLATVFSLADGLRREGSINNSALDRLLESQFISGNGPNGNSESNSGAIRSALPIYKEVSLNGPSVQICSVDDAGVFNKLGNRDFIFLNLETDREVTLSLIKTSGSDEHDPDFDIWQAGQLIHNSSSTEQGQEIYQGQLNAGDYVIEAYDFFNINGTGSRRGDSCYNFSVTG